MALRLVQVNFKARDDSALGRFWAEVIGWGVSSEGSGVTDDLAKLRSCEVATSCGCRSVSGVCSHARYNRVDPHPPRPATVPINNQPAEVARPRARGAEAADIGQDDVRNGWSAAMTVSRDHRSWSS